MKIIKAIVIEGKEAKLILLDDEKTVQIFFDGEMISSSAKSTWNNIKNEEWAQYGLLKIEVENHVKKDQSLKRLKRVAEEIF